jgi:hypothetical protein
MTRELLLSQLRQGSNGEEILQILEVLCAGLDSDDSAVEEIQS